VTDFVQWPLCLHHKLLEYVQHFYYERWSYAIVAVSLSVVRSVCLSVSRITHKCVCTLTKHTVGMASEVIIHGIDLNPDVDSGSLFHFFHHCRLADLRKFISISRTVTGRFLPNLVK